MIPLAVKPIEQTGNDCAIAALAMYTGRSYADVAAAVTGVSPRAFVRGMWCTEIQRAAKALGVTLKLCRRFNIEEDTGILCVDHGGGAHAVVLFQGVIINSEDGMVWDVEAYLIKAGAIPRVLMRPS
jgi:hypothetical protein